MRAPSTASQARRLQREEPDCAGAVGSNDVGPQICFREMRDARAIVYFKRDQPDPSCVVERIEFESCWNEGAGSDREHTANAGT